MNTSYPYLNIARKFGVDYGHVLWYADYMEKIGKIAPLKQHTAALRYLPQHVRIEVLKAYRKEERRKLISRDYCAHKQESQFICVGI